MFMIEYPYFYLPMKKIYIAFCFLKLERNELFKVLSFPFNFINPSFLGITSCFLYDSKKIVNDESRLNKFEL